MHSVDVEEVGAKHHPEDWGDFSILVFVFGRDPISVEEDYARLLSTELGATVLTEPQLDEHMVAFRARKTAAAS